MKRSKKNQHWLSDRVEGPNIANVFKRTFYQMMLKFRIGMSASCAGIILAIPQAVWDSWQRHLGAPQLRERPGGYHVLTSSEGVSAPLGSTGWVYVFDLEAGGATTPDAIVLRKCIATDADTVAYHALKVAPEAAIAGDRHTHIIHARVHERLNRIWPELAASIRGA